MVAAARRFSSACFLFTLSIALAHALWAAGRPLCRSMSGVLAGNDDRQVRDGHPHAVEYQSLRSMSAGRTSEGMPLNSAFRRPVGAIRRSSASHRCTPNISYLPLVPSTHDASWGQQYAERGGNLPLWIAARKGSRKPLRYPNGPKEATGARRKAQERLPGMPGRSGQRTVLRSFWIAFAMA